jgi:4a-hydroxytetrahydrobiopterin dehydratase
VIPASPVSDAQIAALTAKGDWSQVGDLLEGTFVFASYGAALDFVVAVAAIAEDQNHHPEITLGFDRVSVRVSTHETHSITARDLYFVDAVSELR